MNQVDVSALHFAPGEQERPVVTTAPSARQALASGDAMLSFVVPLYNEEDSLDALYERIKSASASFAPNHEIIFVNDGSRDKSSEILRRIWTQDDCVSVLNFRRNSGKAAGLAAGFAHVRGEYVVMMDADLQDQPEEIPKMIARLDEGFDLVTGWKQRRHDPINKTLPSKLFNRTVSRYFNLDIHDFNCGLKLMKSQVVKKVRLYGDFHRFIPVLAAYHGFKVTECVVQHAPRVHGVSKYGSKRLVTGMLDFTTSILVTKFYHKPLQMFGPIGLMGALAGVLTGVYLLVGSMLGQGAHLRPLWLVMVLLILGGAQVFFTGLLAELLVNTSQRDPRPYDVAEALPPRNQPGDAAPSMDHDFEINTGWRYDTAPL